MSLKKISFYICHIWFIFFIVSSDIAIASTHSSNQVFYQLVDHYFDTFYFPTKPTAATQLGIHTYDDKLEDYSKAAIANHVKTLNRFIAKINAINPTNLDEQAQSDRELLLNSIRGELLTLQQIRPWENNPDYYSGGITYSTFTMIERQFDSMDNRLRSLIAREKLMPNVLQEAQHNLKNPPKIYTQIALEQLPGIIKFFQSDVPAAFSEVHNPELSKQFSASNSAVIDALFAYQTWLKQNLLPKAHGDFRIGKENFVKKLQYDEMVSIPLDRLIALDKANMQANQKEFARIAQEVFPKMSLENVLQTIKQDHPAPDQLLNTFRATFDHLIEFIKTKQIITIPSDIRPIMEETPPFMRAITFASMDTPGPFESKAKEAYFNVTLPDSNWPQEKIKDFMSEFNYPNISSIAVHEAYPGHYVQFLLIHDVHDRIRKILSAATNFEGWAHYCEQMMLDEGFRGKDDRQTNMLRLGQLLNALLRNARFIVGIEMHTGQMTFEQAVAFFVKEGYLSQGAAIVETKRGTMDPTYLYYTLGKLQILKLRADLQKKEGKSFNLKQFHDAFMRQGSPPIKIVRKALLHNDSPTL